jgi:hypothetical protein
MRWPEKPMGIAPMRMNEVKSKVLAGRHNSEQIYAEQRFGQSALAAHHSAKPYLAIL